MVSCILIVNLMIHLRALPSELSGTVLAAHCRSLVAVALHKVDTHHRRCFELGTDLLLPAEESCEKDAALFSAAPDAVVLTGG